MLLPQLPEMTQAAMAFTETVTTRWRSRLAGSEACMTCGEHIRKELETFCDHTNVQEFPVRPGAFLGYIRINIVLYGLALLALYVQLTALAAAIATLSVLITVLEFFFYKEFVDFLFPRKTGKNVFGTIEPAAEVKQQIIISAHHDSAHVFNFLEKNPKTYARKIISATLTQFAMLVFSWLLWALQLSGFSGMNLHWILTGILTLAGLSLIPLWFFYRKEGTPGAGDNMICTALAMEIGKYVARQKAGENALKHTRVMIASWDAEECGLRGSRAFVKAHRAALHKVKTYNFNLECMYDHTAMHFLLTDLNHFVRLSADMAQEGVEISQQLGYEIGTTPFPFLGGGTDAAEFAKAGIAATTLAAMNWTGRMPDTAYHTTRDTIEAVDQEAVARAIAVGIQFVLEQEAGIA